MKLRRIITLIALALFITAMVHAHQNKPSSEPQQTSTPNVDLILQNYNDALGGKAAIQKVSSRISKGTIKVPGVTLSGTVDIYEKAPNKRLVIMQVAGLGAMRKGFNGTAGWIEEPLSDGARELSRGELAATRRDADFYWSIRLRELYPMIMFKGKEMFEGRETYVLEAPRAGNPKKWYFDVESGLLVRTTSSEGNEMDEEVYSDYRSVDGVKLPFSIRRSDLDDAVITLTEVKNNVPIADAKFDKPAAEPHITSRSPATTLVKNGQVIPFELYNNNIYLQVRVNGSEPLRFVLDTGASNSAIDESSSKRLGIKSGEMNEANIGGGEGKSKIGIADDISFSLPGAQFFVKHVMVFPMDDLFNLDGLRVEGALGYDFFKRYVAEINYAARKLTLYDPQSYNYTGPGQIIPFKLVGDTPVARARVTASGVPLEGDFHIDTGLNGTFALHTPFVKAHNLLAADQKRIPAMGAGAGGDVKVVVGRVKSFQLGTFLIENPIAIFSLASTGSLADGDTAGHLGGEILRRFKVIFDYSRQRIILEPDASFGEAYEADMSGAFLMAEGADLKTIKVHSVLDDSPAAQVGLRQGDVITAIDGKAASELTLDQIGRLFRQDGRQYLLSIKRGEQSLQIKIKMRRLI